MIIVRNLHKNIPRESRTLFNGVNMDIEQGELVVILGPGGSGKTTLLKCISLYEEWDKGKLFYNDQDIFEMGWRGKFLIRKEWAYIEDQPHLNRRRNAVKNVLAGSRKHRSIWRLLTGTVSENEHMNAMDFLEKAGLLYKSNRPIEKLSGGEVQRVAVAKALAQGAKVVVADEPVSNLDPHTAASIMEDIRKLCQKEKLTFICSLQQIELAEKYATRIIGLSNRNIAFDVTGRRLAPQEKRLLM